MSLENRGTRPASPVGCGVLTISDSRTIETDTSGAAAAEALTSAGHAIVERHLLRDEPREVAALVRTWIGRPDVQLVVTTGGTGITRRDSTYEAVRDLLEKELPGFGEIFRALSYAEIGSPAMLSRATAGVAGRTAIFVLPGSEHAVKLAMARLIVPEVGHITRELAR